MIFNSIKRGLMGASLLLCAISVAYAQNPRRDDIDFCLPQSKGSWRFLLGTLQIDTLKRYRNIIEQDPENTSLRDKLIAAHPDLVRRNPRTGATEFEPDVITCVTQFRTLGSPFPLRYQGLTAGKYKVILVVDPPIEHDPADTNPDPEKRKILGTNQKMIDGGFDADIDKLVDDIIVIERPIWLRIMHEGNLMFASHHAWAPGNTGPKQYAEAYRHMALRIKARLAAKGKSNLLLGFDLDYNRVGRNKEGNTHQDDFVPMFPGNDVVNMVSLSAYGRCGTAPGRNTLNLLDDILQDPYNEAAKLGLPIGIAEISTSGLCREDKILWFADMLRSIRDKYPLIRNSTITFFFTQVEVGAASNTVRIDWGLVPFQRPIFGDLLRDFKRGRPIVGPAHGYVLKTPLPPTDRP